MKVVQVPEIIQEKQWRLSKKLVIAVVSRVTIVPLSDKMQIKYLDTCSYPGETAARKMQRWNEKKFEKCRLKPALLFTISGERPTSTFFYSYPPYPKPHCGTSSTTAFWQWLSQPATTS